MAHIIEVLKQVGVALDNNSGAIGVVLGVLVAVAKIVSNEKAGPIVAKLQAALDKVAGLVESIGDGVVAVAGIVRKASSLLSGVIKSDGLLGKK